MGYIRSFLKYPGNKFSILPKLLSIIKEYNPDVLVEPFMGSCVVSLNAIRSGIVHHAYLNDVNQSVVEMMQMVKDAPYEFIQGYKSLTVDDNLTGKPFTNERYTWVRDVYNNHDYLLFSRGVLFYYLLQNCFNGNVRYNSRGVFNAAYGGDERTFNYASIEMIETFHKYAQQMSFQNMDVLQYMDTIPTNEKCVMYLDPPYHAIGEVDNAMYKAGLFDDEKRKKMAEKCRSLADSGTPCIVSDHMTSFTKGCYQHANVIHTINVPRNLNRKAAKNAAEIIAVYH